MILIVILIAWGIFTYKSYKKFDKDFRFSDALIPLILLGIVSSVSLGVNYLFANTRASDGIGIVGFLSDWIIIQDDKWTRELFWSYFDSSIKVNLLLVCVYSVLKYFRK